MKRLLSLLFLLIFVSIAWLFYSGLFVANSLSDLQRDFEIKKGQSASSIVQQLYSGGQIRSEFVAKVYLRLSGIESKLHAVHVYLPETVSAVELFNILQHPGANQQLIRVTIPEGFTLRDVAAVLEGAEFDDLGDVSEFFESGWREVFQDRYVFLQGIDSLEGYLYPETYFFSPKASLVSIVDFMLRTFDMRIYQLWLTEDVPSDSPKNRFSFHKVLSLASIVEREATFNDELPRVASVYDNRLKKKMRLEADPTVLYALGNPPDKKRVLYKDLTVSSPYNTYRVFGLPPGPISSVSDAAFKATLTPEKTDFLYFVADPATGYHIFTRTYREHINTVNRLRRRNR